jgi:hypothetical protein
MNDCLPSWKNNRTKQTILAFIQAVRDPDSAHFVPPVERIATFDNDGTLMPTTTAQKRRCNWRPEKDGWSSA